ncbi:DUF3168 domain-containing protein [Stappia sp. F7233]|uniref:DUF3168 domain-containing protein n=1 Tax=Stappia albiluteola TaxID=2758565 RepID=A0A839ABH5_9HYPH|nr:DUF3168 domain-containing protein [Stappia albiluteola]MBA5776364.1 DUF3168 domain-containing protein [Stappia albiluteola]
MSAEIALRAAILTRLKGDAGFAAALGGERVFDGAPQRQSFPFAFLAEVTAAPLDADAGDAEELRLTIAVLSRAATRGETAGALDAIREGLAVLDPDLGGYRLANLTVTSAATERLNDGRTWRGTLRLRAVCEPA